MGPAGAKGDTGSQGPAGKEGEKGKDGTDGVSVTSTESLGPIEGHCPEGGSKFVFASGKTYACNGAEGPQGIQGPQGEPWPAGGTLPPLAVETGSWAYAATTADTAGVSVALSFPIQLAAPLEGGSLVHYNPIGVDACRGSKEFPKPEPGHLCVYTNEFPSEITFVGIFSSAFEEEGASPEGAVLKFSTPTADSFGSGTFAVSGACEAPKVPVFIEVL